jgi:hypothetical protein
MSYEWVFGCEWVGSGYWAGNAELYEVIEGFYGTSLGE